MRVRSGISNFQVVQDPIYRKSFVEFHLMDNVKYYPQNNAKTQHWNEDQLKHFECKWFYFLTA